jgi:signal transduction histidine kinase
MHDQIAQSLAIVKLNLNELQAGELGQKEKDLVREMKTLVNDTYVDLRDTVFSLRALQEADIQFLDSFRDYTSTFGAHNHLDIQFGITERDLVQFSRQARLQIGRIIEEALNNVRKHASANHVWIRAGVSEFEGWIMIEDDGIGIDLEKVNGDSQGHFGLPMMKERAESVGGRLEVSLRPEGGTCVKIEIPFQKVPA